MSSVDIRTVQMNFDNAQFEAGIATTMASLNKLNQSLQLQGATKGLEQVSEAAGGISMGPLTSGIDAVTSKFSALSVIGITALANITSKIVDTGIELVKSFTIDPIKLGFQNYETQINSIQTILANTSAAGTTLGQVNTALAQLNTYANLTVYNFSEMAQNIGTFTAAGVGLQTSVSAIKGIANLAAFSGSTSQQASTAMYQLSQAIASGTVKLQDWNSVVNAGLGGKTFQTALENTARASGVAIDSIIKKSGSFRNSLQQGWLTSNILTETLSQFTGDLSVAQIKAMGYTEQQAEQIYALSQQAVNAATKIKTMTQLTDALKEEVATAYAAIFKTIFGNITQATALFSSIHTVAENALTNPIYALNNLLEDWEQMGGRTILIDTVATAFKNLGTIIKAFTSAYREVFPPETAEQIYDLSAEIGNFVMNFKLGANAAGELKQTFAGLFAVVSIVEYLVRSFIVTIARFIGYASQGSGSVLKLTANVGELLIKLQNIIENGTAVTNFFTLLGDALDEPVDLIRLLVSYTEELFDKFSGSDSTKATAALGKITAQLGPIGDLGKVAAEAWGFLLDHLQGLLTFLAPLESDVTNFFDKLGAAINNGFSNLNFDDILGAINTGLFAGLLLLIKKFVSHLMSDDEGPLNSIVKTIQESFESLTETLETMQGALKAATLLEIAAAVGILTISMIELSQINQAGLIRSASAITVMFTQLLGSMVIFQKFVGAEDFAKMPIMMLSLILLASAIDILVLAVKQLAGMDWDTLSRGLSGLGILLAELVATTKLIGNPEGLITTSLGLNVFAKAVKTLTTAVVLLSSLSWEELSKGLTGVAGLLVTLALFTKFNEADKTGLSQGVGIVLLATGIKILASAMQTFGTMSWDTIGKGLTAMAGGLILIVGALNKIPLETVLSATSVVIVASALQLIGNAIAKMGTMSWEQIGKGITVLTGGLGLISAALKLLPAQTLLSATSILIVAGSLNLIADALVKMGAMSWGAIAKSLVELAASLVIISLGVDSMTDAIPGAKALLVVSAALLVLLPVLQAFGNMSWASLGESMAALVGIFTILGVSALLIEPVAPVLLAIGGAVALLGIGIALAGVGVFAFSVALTALAAAGSVGTAALVAMIVALAGLIPTVATQLGLGIIAFAKVITQAGPVFATAMVSVLDALITAIGTVAPKAVTTLLQLLTMLIQQLSIYEPKMVTAGLNLIIGLLNGIGAKIGGVVSAAGNLIIAFLNAISNEIPKVVQAGINLIINFINSMATSIKNNSKAMGQAGGNLAEALIQGMVSGLAGGLGVLLQAAENLGNSILNKFKGVFKSHSPSEETTDIGSDVGMGLVVGLNAMTNAVETSAGGLGKTAITALSKTISGISDMVNSSAITSPVITPIMDLSNVKKSASQISGLLTTKSIDVGSAYSNAVVISAGQDANQSQSPSDDSTTPTQTVNNFNQTINSPKAVATIDVYRQTKNLLSKQRGAYVLVNGSSDQPG